MTTTDPLTHPGHSAYRDPPEVVPEVPPFDARDLRAVALRPHRWIDLVLAERARLAKTIAGGENLVLLSGILLATSVLTTLPYGAVLGPQRALRVAALTLGSVAICFPSLHVFSGYFGCRNRIGQNLGLALLVSAVAGLFTLSFAPIVGFIALTTAGGSAAVGMVSTGLLGFSVLAGVAHLARTVDDATPARSRGQQLVMLAWVALLLFVVHRMGVFLELA